MKVPKRWKTGLTYAAILILLGLTSLTYGLARLDKLPTGKEVVAQGIASKTTATQQEMKKQQTEIQQIAKQSNASQEKTEKQSTANQLSINPSNDEGLTRQEKKSERSIEDFPSPVNNEPLRKVGNYFSENLNAYLFHAGTDYELTEGTVIRATHGGTVIFAGADPILGQKVEMDCGQNWHVVYGGLENLRVQKGDKINANEALGQIGYFPGADGVNDRPQLHFEVWQGDEVQVLKK